MGASSMWPAWLHKMARMGRLPTPQAGYICKSTIKHKGFHQRHVFWSREFSSYKIGDCYLDLHLFLLGHVLWSVPMANHHQIPPFEGIPSRELTYPPKIFVSRFHPKKEGNSLICVFFCFSVTVSLFK